MPRTTLSLPSSASGQEGLLLPACLNFLDVPSPGTVLPRQRWVMDAEGHPGSSRSASLEADVPNMNPRALLPSGHCGTAADTFWSHT